MTRFAIVPHFLFDDERVDHHLLAVYGALALYADKAGHCWPSLDSLAEKLRLSRSSISRYISRLVELGYVRRTRHKDQSCHYFLVVQREPEEGVAQVESTVAPVRQAVAPVQRPVAQVRTNNTKNNTIEQKTKKGTRLDPEFEPSADDITWAANEYPAVDLKRETEKFKNYWLDRSDAGAIKLSWWRTWRNWIMNAEKDYRNVRQLPPRDSRNYGRRPLETDEERRSKLAAAVGSVVE